MIHNVVKDDMFHYFAWYRCKRDRLIVSRNTSVAAYENRVMLADNQSCERVPYSNDYEKIICNTGEICSAQSLNTFAGS